MSRRDDLISTARRMFRERGYQATGIDAILAESGAAKATLYSLFGSKEALILAVLQTEDREFREGLERALGQADAGDRVLAIFDFAGRWFRSDGFNGCLFANAAVEFSDRDGAVHEMVAAHKNALLDLMHAELARADVADPRAVARQLQLLFEGAIITAKVSGDVSAANVAREAAKRLIQAPPEPSATKAKSLVRALMNSGGPP